MPSLNPFYLLHDLYSNFAWIEGLCQSPSLFSTATLISAVRDPRIFIWNLIAELVAESS